MDFETLLREFSELPRELRNLIGPIVASRFLDTGHLKEAIELDATLARAPGDHGPDYALFRARLDLAEGRNAKALEGLSTLVATNAINAADATVIWLETLLTDGGVIPEDLVTEAAARAFELRYTDLGKKLRRLELAARAQLGQQDTAFEILVYESSLGAIDAEDQDHIAAILFQSFDSSEDAAERLLTTYFRYSDYLTNGPEMDPARRRLAQAFRGIGLPQTALDLLEVMQSRFKDRDKELQAGLLLDLNRPEEALAAISGISTEAAAGMRVAAHSQRQAYDRALKGGWPRYPSDSSRRPGMESRAVGPLCGSPETRPTGCCDLQPRGWQWP